MTYNWWTLYHRLLQPGQHHEALSMRPRKLFGAALQTEHAGQRRLDVRLSHAEAPKLQTLIRAGFHLVADLASQCYAVERAETLDPNRRSDFARKHKHRGPRATLGVGSVLISQCEVDPVGWTVGSGKLVMLGLL